MLRFIEISVQNQLNKPEFIIHHFNDFYYAINEVRGKRNLFL